MKFFRFLGVLSGYLLLCASVFAQGTVTGQLTGTVTATGSALPGVTVSVSGPQLQGTRTAVTDAHV